jgi:hypothetical protein
VSAGHGHKRRNLAHHSECAKYLKAPDAQALMQRFTRLDVEHDVPDLAGYSVDGTTRFLDRDFFHALLDPAYAEHLGIGRIDTGLSPDDTIECVLTHEGDEKTILDADNPVDTYEPAHECATSAEHERVRQKGGSPLKYERGLKKAIEWCEKKQIHKPPPTLACAPYLDDADAADDRRVIEAFKKFGVEDASKLSKASVEYSKSTSKDKCSNCANWVDQPAQQPFGLAKCRRVAGLVRNDRWCIQYQEATNGEAQGEPEKPTP